jgi:glycosyltransferase involved in cell wall biosynthesis
VRVAVIGNGQSVHALGRARAVATLGHAVRFFTLGPLLPCPGLDAVTAPLPRGPLEAAGALGAFLNGLRAFRPELVHLHYAGGRLASLATLAGARPLVVTVMGGDVDESQHPGGLTWLERRATRRVLQRADALLVKSEGLLQRLEHWGHFADKARVVRWGVDPAVFRRDPGAARALRERLGLAADDRVVLCPRILAPLYATHLLVEAFAGVVAAVPQAVLLLTEYRADPEYQARLVARAEGAGIAGRLRFVGDVEHAEMPSLLSLAEVVAMAPEADGLPQSLLEAMACETPVVLGDLPAYREAVGEPPAARIVAREPESLAAAIIGLLTHDDRARELAARGRARVEEVGLLPNELDKVDAAYREAVENAAARPAGGPLEWAARAIDGLSLARRSA